MPGKISGLFAAPIVPLNHDGGPNFDEFDRLLDLLLDSGVEGICVGGATSEYPHFDIEERKTLISRAAGRTRGRGALLAAVGASSLRGVLSLARYCLDAGASALLLPAPHFFHYDQIDLDTFCREVTRTVPGRYLLYNLPAFTSGFEFETIMRLLRDNLGLVGLKDSSGDSELIRLLADSRGTCEFSLLAGSDQLIIEALTAGWNGAISGNINLCPELHVSLFRHFRSGNLVAARKCQAAISAISREARALPFPWAIRAGLELGGIRVGPSPLPIAPCRRDQLEAFKQWLARWLESELPELVSTRG